MALLTLLQPTPAKPASGAKAGGARPEDDAGSLPFSQALEHSRTDADPSGPPPAVAQGGPSAAVRAARAARAPGVPATPTQPGQRRDRPGPSDVRQRVAVGEPADGCEPMDPRRSRGSAAQDNWSADPMAAQALVAQLTLQTQTDAGAAPVAPVAPLAPAPTAAADAATASAAGSGRSGAPVSTASEAVPTAAPPSAVPQDLTQPLSVPAAAAAPVLSTGLASVVPTPTAPPPAAQTRLSAPAFPRQSAEPVPLPAQAPEPDESATATTGIDRDCAMPGLARPGADSISEGLPQASGMTPASQGPGTAPTPPDAAMAAPRADAMNAQATGLPGPTTLLPGTGSAATSATGPARAGMGRSERDGTRASGSGVARDSTTSRMRASEANSEPAAVAPVAASTLLRVAMERLQPDASPVLAAPVEAGPGPATSSSASPTPIATAGLPHLGQPGSVAMPSTRPAEAAQLTLPMTLDSPTFAPALGAQVTLLVRAGVEQARIELNPAEMGPVAVQIALDGGSARVDFHAEVAATRQAIEASLPSLASALHDAGLTLTGGGVFQQPQRQAPDAQAPANAAAGGRESAAGETMPVQAAARPLPRRGLIDLVA